MQNNFENELRGSENEALAAQQQIRKYFKRYGESSHQDATKHQLMFACCILSGIAKCELKHPQIYCEIITEIFGDSLKPECSDKYWSAYVNNLRYFHYHLVAKKHCEYASKIYYYICDLPPSKLQTEDLCLAFVSMYCNQMFLQNGHTELNHIVENLQVLFEQMLDRNKEFNLQIKDVLQKCLQCLFPTGYTKMQKLFSSVATEKVARMFAALFRLQSQQRLPQPTKEETQQKAHFIIETLNNFIVFDTIDNFQTQLSVLLLKYCTVDSNLKSDKVIAELFGQLYEYLKIICSTQRPNEGFVDAITKCCDGFKSRFEIYSKNAMNQLWFKDLLVFISTLHTQMQNTSIFGGFWKQMKHIESYQALLMFLLETMKLAPCIVAETKLNNIRCCSSFRKHIILTFANAALSTFVLYCQNCKNEPKEEDAVCVVDDDLGGEDSNMKDIYAELLQKPLLLIISHAFKIIDKMDCIDDKSQDIAFLLTRFKQAAVSACTAKQVKTCMKLAELYLKINHKFSETEWPLLVRRIYKATVQCFGADVAQIREMQLCYIGSLLHLNSEIDFTQIRGQISMYYSDAFKEEQQQAQKQQRQTKETTDTPVVIPPHENCILHSLMRSTNPLRPHLKPCRKKLLHWLEVQHTVKYYRSNLNLMQSLIASSQSYYDFVITARATKLTTAQVPKFHSIHKYLRTKTGLSRLDHLTYGHTCTKLLQEYHNQRSQTTPLETKDFGENQLEQLLLNKEMEKMTICNELQYVKLAYDGFVAFQEFYDRFDIEQISSEDAILDWEAIIDDLTTLAQYLQFGNYLEYASNVWLLHYKISQLVLNSCSALTSLTFFCELSMLYEKGDATSCLDLEKEIQLHLPHITQGLEQLASLTRRRQNAIFLATLQIAYYYANSGRYNYAQILLQFVEEKHEEISERQGCYDIVMFTLDIIRYRLLWKHYRQLTAGDATPAVPKKAENLLLNQCLMDEMERTLDRLRDFSFGSGDALSYNMLISNMTQDMAECSANRLYDNFLNSIFIAACRCAVQYGFALRLAQIMCSWMWINLQMEYVDQAQTKMKIIEYVMGIRGLKELVGNSVKTATDEVKCNNPVLSEIHNDILSSLNHHNDIEAARRLAQVQLSPIKTGKLHLRPEAQITNLKNYFKFKIDSKTLPQNELMDWTYFLIGCLNARLYFLVEDYVQLQPFYEKGREWLEMRQNAFNRNFFKSIQLMAMQHYVNYLRANGQHDKALQCLNYGLEICDAMKWKVDVVYRVNFKLQLSAVQQALNIKQPLPHTESRIILGNEKVKITKKFNISPEEVTRSNKKNVLENANKKQPTASSVASICKRKHLPTNSSSNSSPETKTKPKPKFNICEDDIEIIVDSDDDDMVVVNKNRETKPSKESSSSYTTPKVTKTYSRKTPLVKSSKPKIAKKDPTPSLATTKHAPPSSILASSSSSSLSSTSSSMENLPTKENQPQNTSDLITKLENLDLGDKSKRGRTRLRKSPKKPTPIIILEDSPSLKTVEVTKPIVTKSRSRTRNKNILDSAIKSTTTTSEINLRSTRRRRGDVI
ncbi:protein three rows-like [Musca vetustissima]|uniref:protein three rows-like n=1 Tax=Musca vetustissima TaxID=27455 RepID=UPI002AB632DB|nr:protein three rows-like [Musca vetustissima]